MAQNFAAFIFCTAGHIQESVTLELAAGSSASHRPNRQPKSAACRHKGQEPSPWGCDAMCRVRAGPTFRQNLVPSSSRVRRSKKSKLKPQQRRGNVKYRQLSSVSFQIKHADTWKGYRLIDVSCISWNWYASLSGDYDSMELYIHVPTHLHVVVVNYCTKRAKLEYRMTRWIKGDVKGSGRHIIRGIMQAWNWKTSRPNFWDHLWTPAFQNK